MPASDAHAFFRRHFDGSAALAAQCRDLLAEPAAAAADLMLAAWMNDGKLLAYGDGAAAALADNLCGYLNGRLARERMALPAIALNRNPVLSAGADPADGPARQIHALGSARDVVLLAAAGVQHAGLLNALAAAHEHKLPVIALTGGDGGALAAKLVAEDLLLNIPHTDPLWVLETQTVLLHALCGHIDHLLLGEAET